MSCVATPSFTQLCDHQAILMPKPFLVLVYFGIYYIYYTYIWYIIYILLYIILYYYFMYYYIIIILLNIYNIIIYKIIQNKLYVPTRSLY